MDSSTPAVQDGKSLVLELLRDKSCLKQTLSEKMDEVFADFKRILGSIYEEYHTEIVNMKRKKDLRFQYSELSQYDAQLTFGGDILYFTQHSNIFDFEPTHAIHQTPYVKEDENRAYCGMIQLHNFLFDSIDQQRNQDIGYLVARIFINKDGHFFVEGKRQLGFLYNDFENAVINNVYIRAIIESAMIYTIDFDLLVPPYEAVQMITVQQKLHQQHNRAFQTGKRMGFKFQNEQAVEARKK